jgi:glucokinase
MTDSRFVAGVDLGATKVRAAIGKPDGTLTAIRRDSTPQGNAEAILTTVQNLLRDAIDAADIEAEAIDTAGIGSMGPLDHEAGAVVDPPNLEDVGRIPIVSAVESVVDAPAILRNDATAGAVGIRFYSGEEPSNLVYVTISSGLGGGAIVDGRPLLGENGNAAEVGHFPLAPDSEVACNCEGTGHWEGFCSGENLPEYARHLAREEGVPTDLSLPDLKASELFASDPEDSLAATVVDRFGKWNVRGAAAVVHAYDPALIVFGGGVTLANRDAVLDPIRDGLPEMVLGDPPAVRLTELGDETVLRGAVAVAIHERARRSEGSL